MTPEQIDYHLSALDSVPASDMQTKVAEIYTKVRPILELIIGILNWLKPKWVAPLQELIAVLDGETATEPVTS